MDQSLISSSPDVLGGTPVFAGTRVPVQTLFDYLEGGETIDDWDVDFAAGAGPIVVESPGVSDLDPGDYAYQASFAGDDTHDNAVATCEPFTVEEEEGDPDLEIDKSQEDGEVGVGGFELKDETGKTLREGIVKFTRHALTFVGDGEVFEARGVFG